MKSFILLVAALGLTGGASFAQAPQASAAREQMLKDPQGSFKALDADANAEVSKAEWLAAGRRDQGFARFDANADGKLMMAEWEAAVEMMKNAAGRAGQ
ncbi:MAG: hypothetical protein SGJ21_04755 [Alphaproteobacteria bacterium]|nr:hypothetical protein [Alphaproteobacteria bacterium]